MKKTFSCFFCDNIHKEEDPIEIRCSVPGFKMYACLDCVKRKIISNDHNYVYHDGIMWASGSRPDIRSCMNCGRYFIPSEKATEYYKNSNEQREQCKCFKCSKSSSSQIVYCFDCKGYHKKGMHFVKGLKHNFKSSYGSGGSINFSGSKDYKNWMTGGTETLVGCDSKSKAIEQLPFQEVRELPNNIINEIDRFYGDRDIQMYPGNCIHYMTHYNFRDDVNIEGELTLKFGSFEQDLRDAMFKERPYYYTSTYSNDESILKGVKSRDLKEGIKQNKYRNMYFDSIDDDGYVVWKFIDIFGNLRTKKESVNVFYQAQGLNINNNSATMKLRYRLSSNLTHKLDAFLRNDQGNFNSCQRAGNRESLARGAYDTITNGCICPILIYKLDDPNRAVGRITTRLMYDNEGEMYILLERLYHDGSFSKQIEKGEVYKQIILDLKSKGFKVIVSNYSAHDNTTLQYVESLGLQRTGSITNLYQPLRQLYRTGPASNERKCGYYADGGTECLTNEINGIMWSTDYLDKAYLL